MVDNHDNYGRISTWNRNCTPKYKWIYGIYLVMIINRVITCLYDGNKMDYQIGYWLIHDGLFFLSLDGGNSKSLVAIGSQHHPKVIP